MILLRAIGDPFEMATLAKGMVSQRTAHAGGSTLLFLEGDRHSLGMLRQVCWWRGR